MEEREIATSMAGWTEYLEDFVYLGPIQQDAATDIAKGDPIYKEMIDDFTQPVSIKERLLIGMSVNKNIQVERG